MSEESGSSIQPSLGQSLGFVFSKHSRTLLSCAGTQCQRRHSYQRSITILIARFTMHQQTALRSSSWCYTGHHLHTTQRASRMEGLTILRRSLVYRLSTKAFSSTVPLCHEDHCQNNNRLHAFLRNRAFIFRDPS